MKVDPYKLLILRKAGYTQRECGKYFNATQGHISQVERKWQNNGIGNIEKVIIDSAKEYGAEKALDFLELKRLVDKFVKEREKNEAKCDNAICSGVASDCVHYKSST